MIVILGRLVSYGELWFDEVQPRDPRVDVLTYRLWPGRVPGARSSRFLSLVSDLTADERALMARLGNTNRYKINRANNRDGLTAEFLAAPAARLEEFRAFYDAFAGQKKLAPSYRRGLEASCAAGQLVLSAASRDGRRIVWHAYVTSGGSAALLHSASHFRAEDGVDRALVGRANRWLHWKDMLEFKAAGYRRYDWGGMFEDESVAAQASINNFKREFGGDPIESYNCTMARTVKGRAYTACLTLVDRVRGVETGP
ncbi:MAG TPA: hypothetical protein VHP37_06985 [Burkholderiales bacterium]|nr:hypothetical protein [Burkholderiales bacterium]